MSHKVKKGGIYSKKGIPEEPRWFADGRLSFEFSGHGVTRVHYFYPAKTLSSHVIFYQRLWDGFRFYVERDGLSFKPELGACCIWPYGMTGDWALGDCIFRLSVLAVNEAIAVQLETPSATPQGMAFKMEYYDQFALTPADRGDLRMADMGAERVWRQWRFDEERNMLLGGFEDTPRDGLPGAEVGVAIAASFPLQYACKRPNTKRILKSGSLEPGKAYSILVDFSCGRDTVAQAREKLIALPESIAVQQHRYERVAASSPVLISPYRQLNDFISLAPLYHEASKIPGIPGAVRASNVHYWVWGWDGMTSNHSTAYWGDLEHIRGMLALYEQTADPAKGIVHAFRYDMIPDTFSALPAQGMYICLLHQYWGLSGDRDTVSRHYAFARLTFRRIAATESGDTGFCKGTSLYPDFPDCMQETGNDLSAFNNTVFYCAARAMESLAAFMDDAKTQREALDTALKMERSFTKLFFEEEKGFVVSSVDAGTHKKRLTFNLSALKWENNYLQDLLAAVNAPCIDFIGEHLVSSSGLREIPVWDSSFDGDANQLHCWWPVNSEYFIRMANAFDRTDLIEKFIGYIGRWTKKLCCPEGISYYTETDEAEADRWNTLKGAWQAYSIRGWYQAVMHGIVGVDVDAGGVTFYPYSGSGMKLNGMPCRGQLLDIKMMGAGQYIRRIDVNGRPVTGTHKLPADCLGRDNRVKIIVRRMDTRPEDLWLKQAAGVEISIFQSTGHEIKARVRGAGQCRILFGADRDPCAVVDGKDCPVQYDTIAKLATVEILFERYGDKELSVRC